MDIMIQIMLVLKFLFWEIYIFYRLDGKHVVFGQVDPDCMSVVQALEKVGSQSGKTSKPVTITNSGQL